jgi:hypothetical protein
MIAVDLIKVDRFFIWLICNELTFLLTVIVDRVCLLCTFVVLVGADNCR